MKDYEQKASWIMKIIQVKSIDKKQVGLGKWTIILVKNMN